MGTRGGGQILDFIGTGSNRTVRYIDEGAIRVFELLPYVKFAVFLMLILIMVLVILRIFKVRTIFRPQALANELSNVANIRRTDKYILISNKMLAWLVKIIKNSPLTISKRYADYLQYNINRANIKAPGGYRNLTAEEFNALVKSITVLVLTLNLVVAALLNVAIGLMLGLSTIFIAYTMPLIVLRAIVAEKDTEIRENFSDLYLMLHYVLLSGGSTPIDRLMKSFAKTTNSEEMKVLVDNCVNLIETHGEYSATRYIAKDYREVAEINKLMRLIRQLHEGGDVKQELMGFRDEIISQKKYSIENKMNKLVRKARVSFYVLSPILVQAVISAMAIYLPDLGSMGGIFGL